MRKAIHNPSAMPMYVAGTMIPPGETRHFDDDMIPPEFRDPAPERVVEPDLDPLAELAAKNAVTVLAALVDLCSEDLARLQLLEIDGKARKTVLEGIAGEGLKRAQADLDKGAGETGTGDSSSGESSNDSTTPPPAGDTTGAEKSAEQQSGDAPQGDQA